MAGSNMGGTVGGTASLLLLLLGALAAGCTRAPADGLQPEASAAARATVGGVEYDARTERLAGDTLRTSITLTNRSAAPVDLVVPGGCPVLVRAYATEARSGEAAWDQAAAVVCTMELRMLRLEPNASETMHSPGFTPADIRAAGAPSGRYYLTGVIAPESGAVELAAGTIDL